MSGILDQLANFNPTGFALKNQRAAAEIPLVEAQTADTQAQVQQRTQQARILEAQQRDAEAIRDAYANYGPKSKPDDLLKTLAGKLTGQGFIAFQKHQLELQKMAGEVDAQQRAQMKTAHDEAADLLRTYETAPKDQRATVWKAIAPGLQKYAGDIPVPQEAPDDTGFRVLSGLLHYTGHQMGFEAKAAETANKVASTNKAVVDTKTAEAKLPGVAAEAEQEVRAADAQALAQAFAQGPTVFQAALDKMEFGRAKHFAGAKTPEDILRAGMKPQEVLQDVRKVEDQATMAKRDERQERAQREAERHNRASEERMAAIAGAGLNQQANTRVNQISSQFDNEPIVKQYNVISEAKQFIDSLGTGKKATASDDQGLLYSFAKAMDPGSVVREGEYATVQKYSQSWADQFGFKAARIFSNSPFLTDEARKMLKDTIRKKEEASARQYDNVYNEYGRRIEKQAGVKNGSEFLTNYKKANTTAPAKKMVRARDPQGNLHEAEEGTALPAGWKLEKP